MPIYYLGIVKLMHCLYKTSRPKCVDRNTIQAGYLVRIYRLHPGGPRLSNCDFVKFSVGVGEYFDFSEVLVRG